MVPQANSLSFDSSITGILCNVRTAMERDSLPTAPGDKFNVVEGLGAFCYRPCLTHLTQAIHVFEGVDDNPWTGVARRVGTVACVAFSGILAAVGFVIKRIGALFPHDTTVRTESVFEKTVPEKIDQIYELIDGFSRAAEEIGLDYRMISGTALGAVRHGGIIPWDDDGDFGVLDTEKEKIDRAIADGLFARHGLEVKFFPDIGNYQLQFTEERRGGAVDVGTIDLFLMHKTSANNPEFPVRIDYVSTEITGEFPHDFFTEQEWGAVEDWKFGPQGQIHLKGVSREATERYVKRAYGVDCMTCGLKTHRHSKLVLPVFCGPTCVIPVITREKVLITDFRPAYGLKWHG